MSIKKFVLGIGVLVAAATLGACSNSGSSSSSGEKTEVTFWAAPNPTQVKYWKSMAADFEKKNKNIDIKVTQMKESPSSEATIQSAIASGTQPTMSENITRSFAAQLAQSKAIVALNKDSVTKSGLTGIVKARNMSKTMGNWQFANGSQYVVPFYSNPMLFGWRLDLLKELGINQVPKTYSDVMKVADALKAKKSKSVVWALSTGADPTAWQRWFDFFPLYDAASDGHTFVDGKKFAADAKAGKEVFSFVQELYKSGNLLTSKTTDPFETKLAVMNIIGSWTFPNWKEKYPDLKFGENYTLTAPIVPDSMKNAKNIKTYADAKGIVIYAKATADQKKAAMKFMKFVFGNAKNDVQMLETTSLLPARDDAATNAEFSKYFAANPFMKVYAENVPNGVPAMDNSNYNDIQESLGKEGWIPALKGEKTPAKAWSDMVTGIKGSL